MQKSNIFENGTAKMIGLLYPHRKIISEKDREKPLSKIRKTTDIVLCFLICSTTTRGYIHQPTPQ